MQVIRGVVLAAVLVAGCDRREPAGPEEAAQSASAEDAEAEKAPTARRAEVPRNEALPAEPPTAVPQVPKLSLEELQPGITRDQLIASIGDCVERVKLITPTAARRSLEVFQPHTAECKERVGEKQFIVVGDRLSEVQAGLRPKLPPPVPSDDSEKYTRRREPSEDEAAQ